MTTLRHFVYLFYLVMVVGVGCTWTSATGLSSRQQIVSLCLSSSQDATTELMYQQIRERIRAGGFADYLQSLEGKPFEGWSGWVIQLDHSRVALDMDEYEADPTFNTFSYEGIRRTGLADVILEGVSDDVINQWQVGKRVIFSGVIRKVGETAMFEIDPAVYRYAIIASANEVRVDEGKYSKASCDEATTYPVITLTQPHCTMMSSNCFTLGLTIYGDGLVIYTKRDWETDETIRKTAQISESEVRQLAQAFADANYFSLSDNYDGYDALHSTSATTSITFTGRRKSIFCYYGDLSAPSELRELEELIIEIVDIEQFE